MSPRRITILLAVFVALLVVIAGSSQRQTTPTGPVAALPASKPGKVVRGTLPADGRVVAGVGDVVELTVVSDKPDVAEIPSLGLSVPVGPETTAPLTFVADIPGEFEVDLRYTQERVGTLVVRGAATG